MLHRLEVAGYGGGSVEWVGWTGPSVLERAIHLPHVRPQVSVYERTHCLLSKSVFIFSLIISIDEDSCL
jgi:hypothetical protein